MALKPSTTIDEQLSLLTERGMAIDEGLARQWLKSVSYFRLSGYWYPYREPMQNADPRNPQRYDYFVSGASFEQITRLYEFDRKLRTLVHDGMERIEVALRARISEALCTPDSLAYQNAECFRVDFDHVSWLATALNRIARAKGRDQAIKHYANTYRRYPIWVLVEVLDFSDLSRLFQGLPRDKQRVIAESFGLVVNPGKLSSNQRSTYYSQDPFARWCEQLTVLRNVCAHHGRLWNRHLTPASTNAFRTIDALDCLPAGQSDRLFGALAVMSFLISNVSPGSTWPQKLRSLVENEYLPLEHREISEMGLPENWQTLPLWNFPQPEYLI